jgi:CheY-like chemotaxis protein
MKGGSRESFGEMLAVSPHRLGLVVSLVVCVVSVPGRCQPLRSDLEQLRRPTTVPGLWAAVKAEVAVGKFDTAAAFLKDLLALEPSDKDLVQLEERDGIAAFLELNNVARWSSNEALDREAKTNVKELIARVTKAVNTLRSDRERIQRFIKNLTATPEERDYALIELRKSGPAAMPYLVGALISAELVERNAILSALKFLDADTVPALLASFDITNSATRVELLDVLANRRDLLDLLNRTLTDPRPTLWRLAAGNDLVASKARLLLSHLFDVPHSKLPLPVHELVKAAEDMYQHRNSLVKDGPQITLWRWEEKKLTSQTVTPSQAEEYLGLRYARWALELEPQNEAALTTYLSLAAEKALERSAAGSRLAKASPAVHQMFALAPARILYRVLDRALRENHPLVALAATQVIGERAEVHEAGRFEPLLKALHGQDRRLALAAADALIHLPADVGPRHSSRIVEVYRRALASDGPMEAAGRKPRVLIADPNELRAKLMSEIAEQASWEPVVVSTGREAMRQLSATGATDAVWICQDIVYPTLPELLAQLRSDYRFGRLPLAIYVPIDVSKGRLPEINGLLDRLEYETAGWLRDEINVSPAVKALRENGDAAARARGVSKRLLEVDRSRYPLRVELRYDALKLSAERLEVLSQWLEELARRHPTIRMSKQFHQEVLITIERNVPGLNERLDSLAEGIPGAISRRVSNTLYRIELPTETLPDVLAERLGRLLRDFGYEIVDDVRHRVLQVERQIPAIVTLTMSPIIPTESGAISMLGKETGVNGASPALRFHPDFERDKIYRQIDVHLAARLHALVHRDPSTLLVAEPLNSNEFLSVQNYFVEVGGPTAAPLSAEEAKEHRRRAIEALRKMALGILPGYDVRPATPDILRAVRDPDLAILAIEAAGRLQAKEVQFTLAEVIIDIQRPGEVRRLAAHQLVRQIQQLGVTSLTEPQIVSFIRLVDEEKDPGVKANLGLIIGTLPRDRVLATFAEPQAKEAWDRRLLQYQPKLEKPMHPMNESKEKPNEEPKSADQ